MEEEGGDRERMTEKLISELGKKETEDAEVN
jgi:hypothetical protein